MFDSFRNMTFTDVDLGLDDVEKEQINEGMVILIDIDKYNIM